MDRTDNGKKTVFLADDHALVREGLAALVEKTGQFTVVGQCGDGLDVVEQVTAAAPDVVLLDVGMPGLNGIDICRELGRKAPASAVLILSMHDGEEFIIRALENGAKGYLLKESAGEELAEALRVVAEGRRYLDPAIPGALLAKLHKGIGDPYEKLTTRERQVLQLIAEGNTNKKVAEALQLAVKTIDTHRMRLMRKLNIHDQTALVKFAVGRGIVSSS
ncbi:MAG: response regulator transcription factor [Planctomycetota bacterium]|nr:response regulator transcription factor [Planctomycetota bacterium]